MALGGVMPPSREREHNIRNTQQHTQQQPHVTPLFGWSASDSNLYTRTVSPLAYPRMTTASSFSFSPITSGVHEASAAYSGVRTPPGSPNFPPRERERDRIRNATSKQRDRERAISPEGKHKMHTEGTVSEINASRGVVSKASAMSHPASDPLQPRARGRTVPTTL